MSEPFSGEGQGQQLWDGQPTGASNEDGGYLPQYPPTPPGGARFPGLDHAVSHEEAERERSAKEKKASLLIMAVIAAILVVGGGVAAVWLFGGGEGAQVVSASQAPASTNPYSNNGPKASYAAGTCLYEQQPQGQPNHPGVFLVPVQCGSPASVLTISAVVNSAAACAKAADYTHHGFVLSDQDAHVAYCLSLVVPVDQCFTFRDDNSKPIQRVACGSSPTAVRVLAIEAGTDVNAVCADRQPPPDVWFYQSPTSGQFACVSKATG